MHDQTRSRLSAMPLGAAALLATFSFVCSGQTNVLTYHNDNSRTGQNLSETILTHSNVNSTSFGKLFTLSVDGKVDAQPLIVSGLAVPNAGTRNVVFVSTEHDSVYAFDADTGTAYWHVSMLKAGETTSDTRGCGQVVPEIGITSTSVIDRAAGPHGTIYVAAMSKDASGNYFQRLHALDITTGAEQFGGPVDVHATYPGTGDNSQNGSVVFDPKQYKERAALLLVNGVIYTSWASHCDIRPYTGWVMGYNELTLAQTGVLNVTPNGNEAAIWAAGGGTAADAAGNLYFQLGNGTFDTTLNAQGFPISGDFGNAFVKVPTTGALKVSDYWNMDNTVSESSNDQDLGSGGLALLPDVVDANGVTRHLGLGAGKDRNIYVFDRDNMGKFNASNNNSLYQELAGALSGGEFANPAYWNGNVYFGSVGDMIRAYKVSAARLSATTSSTSAHSFAYPGTTPSISANGANNGILWAAENSSPAVLHAYDATNLATELYNSSQAANSRDQFGAGNKFITPTIANGKVYVGTTNGVGVFGLLAHSAMSTFQTESLPFTTSGPELQKLSWARFPDGLGTKLVATKAGDWVSFTVNVPAAGNYDVQVDVKKLNTRGIFQLSVNGVNVGPTVDEYASGEVFGVFDLGSVTIGAAGNAAFKFTVTGKNSKSSDFTLGLDYIKLTQH